MATLVLRNVKGSPLTNTEVDANFNNLNTDVGLRVFRSGDTMTGPLVLSGAPTIDLHASTKKYVDDLVGARLQLAGGQMTGKLLGVAPSTGGATFNAPVGSADPTSPANGDVWNNAGVLKHQVAGVTKVVAFTDSAMSGNAATASVWQTARSLTLTGDGIASLSVNGSADVSAALTLAIVNSGPGTFGSSTTIPTLIIDGKGRVTGSTAVSIRAATTAVTGIVQLTDTTNTTSSTIAATATAVKAAYDKIKIYDSTGTQLI